MLHLRYEAAEYADFVRVAQTDCSPPCPRVQGGSAAATCWTRRRWVARSFGSSVPCS